MHYILVVALPSLVVLLSQTILGDDEIRNGTTCPEGTFVHSNQDDALTFFTDNSLAYDTVWFIPTSNRLPVRVKAFKDAHFRLQTSNTSVAYLIVLGAFGNSRADIRLLGIRTLKETVNVGLLRFDEFVPFVIAWNSSRLVVTKGPNESDIVVEWSDPTADIDVLSISLAGYQPTVQGLDDNYLEAYQFSESEVSSFGLKTPARFAYKRFQRTLRGQDGQKFNLTATGDATIAFLSSGDNDFKQSTYTLAIGTQSNTQTVLYYRNHQLLLSNHTPGILSNREQREFWVAWRDGRFAFGVGSEFYQNSRLVSPDSMAMEKFHSMAVDSTQQAIWNFVVQDTECVSMCPVGWYSHWRTGDCRKCSTQISSCFSCTQDQSSERPICSECANGTVMLGEGGECLLECPSHVGYTSDYGKRKCVCNYGSCCGPVAFRFCFQVIPCLLGLVILVLILFFVVRRFRHLYIIDPQRIDFDRLSTILKLIRPHVMDNLYVELMRNPPGDSHAPNDFDYPMATLLT